MNKAEIVDAIMEKRPKDFKSRASAERTVNAVFDVISDAVASGDTVGIVGFGTFKQAERAERVARNPQNGESIVVPAHSTPVFRASDTFKKKLA